jgi:NhaP-type Na+/H+ or K+/H+ antiporter
MQNIDVIMVALFAVATVVALIVRKLLVPYTVGLVLAGLLLGATHVLRPPHLTKELLFAVFLPGLLKTLGVPSRLGVLIEGESLLNDGTAAVFFGIILGIASEQGASVAGATREFVRVVGGGFLVGGIIGMAASQIIRRVDEAMIEITLTTLAAYGSFVASEHLHVSGVVALRSPSRCARGP